ncbi:MAG: pilus assembly protein PilP [Deltaproteobacteria bacterium]|nr:pilus assembly protein PilP [Deltaproteobacteria bacterium]
MMKRRDSGLSLYGVLMLTIALGMATAEVWAAETKAAPPAAKSVGAAKPVVKPAPPAAPKPSSPPAYQRAGKPDPFHPFIETELALQKKLEADLKKKETVQAAKKRLPISPLQQAEIAQFRLVGIAGDDRRRTAVVEDGTVKKFYPLFVGTVIGLSEGRVVEILPDRVIVEERIEDQNPKAKKAQIKRSTMMLRKEEEGIP